MSSTAGFPGLKARDSTSRGGVAALENPLRDLRGIEMCRIGRIDLQPGDPGGGQAAARCHEDAPREPENPAARGADENPPGSPGSDGERLHTAERLDLPLRTGGADVGEAL